MNSPRAFAALKSRNYRLFFFGQSVSLIGTWMTQTASLWLVYQLTSSPVMLGIVGFAAQIPIFFLSPFAGVLADRVNRHRLLILTQLFSMLQSFALAALTFTGHMNIHILIVLTLLQGVINAVDLPVRQALVVAFVEERAHLGSAIALNSAIFNLARLLGPAISGFVIASAGVAACYLIDGFSYLAVLCSLVAMRLALPAPALARKHPIADLREGFQYAFGSPPLRALILTLALMSFLGFSNAVLTPMFARDIFGGNAKTLGYLMSASGVGALIGSAYLGSRKGIQGLANLMAVGGFLMGLGALAFAASRHVGFALPALIIVGLGSALMMASGNTLLQSLVEERKRGRVMSIFTMAFTGTMPLGNLLIGEMAGKFGAPLALTFSGSFCLIIAAGFCYQLPKLRAASASVPATK